jgi:hypothetical protein
MRFSRALRLLGLIGAVCVASTSTMADDSAAQPLASANRCYGVLFFVSPPSTDTAAAWVVGPFSAAECEKKTKTIAQFAPTPIEGVATQQTGIGPFYGHRAIRLHRRGQPRDRRDASRQGHNHNQESPNPTPVTTGAFSHRCRRALALGRRGLVAASSSPNMPLTCASSSKMISLGSGPCRQ